MDKGERQAAVGTGIENEIEIEIEIELNVAHSVPELMETGRASNRGRPRSRGRDNLDTQPASISTGTVLATHPAQSIGR